MTNEDKLIRAGQARDLLDNKLFNEAFEETKARLVENLETVREDAHRDKLVLSLQLLKNLRNVIQEHVNTGKILEKSLQKRSLLNNRGM